MSSNLPTPSSIKPVSDALIVHWSNGKCSIYAYKRLRLLCPCASCVDEITGEVKVIERTVPDDVVIADYFEVGRYALQFLWSDGHETGIYPYRMLLKLAEVDETKANELE